MRILYASEGTNVHDQRFVSALADRGHEVHLASFCMQSIESLYSHKIRLHHIRSPTWHILDPFLLTGIIRRVQPDVVHSGFLQTYGFSAALANYHPILSMPWGSDVLRYPDKSPVLEAITVFTLSRADMITCDCEFVQSRIMTLANIPKEKIVVFPWGIDRAKFNPQLGDGGIRQRLGWKDKLVVIQNRSFREVYGVEYLVRAIPSVVKEVPDARFLICGSGPLESRIRDAIEELGISSYVHLPGFIRNHELANHLNAADIYVSCSLSDGASVSLLEAMGCGLPVVVTDFPANLEWVTDGENGFLTPRANPKILANKIVQLLRSIGLRRAFGNRNINIIKNRADWPKNVSILESIYQQLVRA